MSSNSLTPQVRDVALALMEGLDCPRALSVAILIRYEEWDALVQMRAVPLHYNDPEDYFRAAAATDFLRKYPDFKLSLDPKRNAIEKWWAAERDCYRTNERLSPLVYGSLDCDSYDEVLSLFVSDVQKKVRQLLGDGPPSDFQGRFGPGATVSDKSRYCTVPDKMSSVPTFTSNSWPYLVPWTGTKWAEASAELGRIPSKVRGNMYFSVPKDATTERGCAKGPSINVFYQLGLGRIMKERLRIRGLNLYEGQAVHRRVACAASQSGELATIDLSSASDTVCYNLVKLLLPPRWFAHLDALRETHTLIEGKWVRLEKFSAMGNGFTFELETTIFAAIASVACGGSAREGRDLLVYGDDLIVPSASAGDVLSALKFFGFTPNLKKTFYEGSFRESCGGDFYDGISVRPYSLEGDPREPQQLISLANGIRRLASQVASHPVRYADRADRIRRAWFKCLDFIPSAIRACRGPEALGDLVIHDDDARWITRWRANGIRWLRVYRPARYRKVRWEGFAYSVQFSTALYLAGTAQENPVRDPQGNIIPRDGVLGYKLGWVPYS